MTNASRPLDRPSDPAAQPCCGDLRSLLRPELFKALGDPVRVAVVCRLAMAMEPQTVTDMADCCGVHLSGVSRHLATLRDAGVVEAERVGREVRYRLDCGRLAQTLRQLAGALDACHAACRGD